MIKIKPRHSGGSHWRATPALWGRLGLMGIVTAVGAFPGQLYAEAAAEEHSLLEEVIVTAQRREERLQDVPIAVAAVTAESLKDNGIDTTRDLPQMVPSVQFTRSGASGLIFIRGVGTTNAAVGEESGNAVYVDGVYLADLAQAINNFNNIERIEVLKGPQGTLFGRNATGGLIHIITREPGDELAASGEVGYGNYNTISGRAYVAGPITDKVSADIALTGLDQKDGWGRNLTLNRDNNIQDYWGARSKVVLRASDELKFTLAGDYSENRDNLVLGYKLDPGTLGSGGFTGPAGHDTTLNNYPLTKQKIWGVSLTAQADLSFATLTSITALRESHNDSDFDVDGGPSRLIRIAFSSGSKAFQQELRLASNDTKTLAWQAGLFYLRPEATNDSNFTGLAFAPGGLQGQHIVADLKTDSYAAFAEVTYSITQTTKLIGGGRYTKDKRDFDGRQANVTLAGVEGAFARNPNTKLDYDAWTYRVALQQILSDDINVYASFNRGFKSGSYSLQSPLNAPYLPQYIDAYELGLKSELFDRRLRLNVAGFHYEISDYQVRSAAAANPGASLILNAATVKVDGVDLEFETALFDQLRLFGGVTYVDSKFDEFGGPNSTFQSPIVYPNPATCPAALRGTPDPGVLTPGPRTGGFTTCFGDVSGNDTPNAPQLTASLGASYTMPVGQSGEVRLSALYSYNDGYVFEPDNIARQGSYNLLNSSLEYRPVDKFGIELWGRNLGDTEYAVQKITTNTGVTAGLGAPRTYGVNFKFDF
jgi:iron complex outermembrane receptor protein